ncbi:aromatic-ring-hydroxylating dioxygenase subunit beta [Variovorax dokdonensis]|uniref:Aromatic-ring-hydroxylating dioxygenase subunit beta n=1 Tax=Variovorax dokdonensis TaxID=344883 RepID=A0ABT7N885_9BURK|nr:aromatic-ring-hydroxylating dioxygenase subunit beta [Variovorax dokdonensis]MDM0044136.1 aromatic-ring-hydroxylating dioxygenase subunit beta [Variovorax dokdonensis]
MNEFNEMGLCDFVAREASLLDDGRFDEWLALFAEDGRYWVPLLGRAQHDAQSHNSIAFEDRLLLQLRVDRLKDPRAHSQHPASRCQHVLQNSRVEQLDVDAGSATLRTPFLYIEARGEQQLMLAGSYHHVLVRTPQGTRIQLKRVDLLGAERALPAVQLFI